MFDNFVIEPLDIKQDLDSYKNYAILDLDSLRQKTKVLQIDKANLSMIWETNLD